MILLLVLIGLPLSAADPAVFSHKTHAALKLPCASCHKGAETKERAGFPAGADCAVCHTTGPQAQAKLPSRRVYRVPDFVFFSHARHRAAKVECRTCHGDVGAEHALKVEHPTTMKACVDCHRSASATVECTACHELSQ